MNTQWVDEKTPWMGTGGGQDSHCRSLADASWKSAMHPSRRLRYLLAYILMPVIMAGLAAGAPATTAVHIVVNPGVCPNVLPVGGAGNLSVAILGSDTFDVTKVDPSSVRLHAVDGFGTLGTAIVGPDYIGSVAPTPNLPQFVVLGNLADQDILGNCAGVAASGMDLVLKFSIPAVVQSFSLGSLPNGATVPLGITGSLIGGGDFSSLDFPDYITVHVAGAPSVTSVVPDIGATTVAPNDFVITAPATIHLTARVSANGTPSFQWFQQGGLRSGVGEVFFDAPASQATQAIFTTAGQYLIRVTARLPKGQAQRVVRVTVNLNPNGVFDPSAISQLLSNTAPDPVKNPDTFLTFGFFSGNQTDSTTAEAYYQAIDPKYKKKFFGDWLTENNIDPAKPSTYILAAYFNAIDLGFGRRMIGSNDGSAWVVTNYRTVEDAVNDVNPIAAVAMEYQTSTGTTDCSSSTPCFTKFYIYDRRQVALQRNSNTGQLDSPRVTSADLDGGGQKFLPGLCIVCHGGANPPNVSPGQDYPNNGDVHGHFLPFDLNALEYSSHPHFTRDAQQDVFREFNQKVLNIEIQNPDPSGNGDKMRALIELIEGWYGQPFNENGATLSGPQNSEFIAEGWRPPQASQVGSTIPAQLYTRVIARSCRNCHSTRTDSPAGGGLNFARLIDPVTGSPVPALSPSTVEPPVFGFPVTDLIPAHITTPPTPEELTPSHAMPHIRRTFERFWLSTSGNPLENPPAPPQPEVFRRFICDFLYPDLVCR